jgi:hypothetical protein
VPVVTVVVVVADVTEVGGADVVGLIVLEAKIY